ncbi:hypothetical protein [Paenibacillus sanguinis]|uniref:hypothetical protein n=1 Tax=Paenibacillus sanguinis TaxID=225906 RepID=UPI00037CCD11|nr:hypothetical protein [Paenibacillus sanguinis]
MNSYEDKTAADFEYERYKLLKEYRPENDIPNDDLLPHDTQVVQGISKSLPDAEQSPSERQRKD